MGSVEERFVLADQALQQETNETQDKPYMPIQFFSEEEKKKIDDMEKGINKKYLILFAGYVNDSEEIRYKQWDFAVGRQNAYDVVVETFMSEELAEDRVTFDAYLSRIIVESDSGKVKLDGISIYKFMKNMKLQGLVEDHYPNFDIEEWVSYDDVEQQETN
ncbi:MAG: hypothetical protein PHC62_01060 [Candidatus Izemoplasmatales bacterium]|nr:hypothetical protein [Candidatus Izemoplasmatales bacterium]